ncbi:MAG: hypothetical protein IPI73_17730 [Betaproteobacteria bacterium]|nr:hypothetical protein [Betaproteobacteria bacterium]
MHDRVRKPNGSEERVVRITASGGAIGLGNVDPVPGYSTETADQTVQALKNVFAPAVLGGDPANIHVLNQRLAAAGTGFLDAKAAIEMACVDLAARPWRARSHVSWRRRPGTRYLQRLDRRRVA